MKSEFLFIRAAAVGALLFCQSVAAHESGEPVNSKPRVFLLNADRLVKVREAVRAGETNFAAALARLESDARAALKVGPLSVTQKTALPPSGDKHDYMSQAPYFWPNPTNENRLPYIRRDGERNPEINQFPDHSKMNRMAETVETLALAYYFRRDEKYAERAAELLRTWFLNSATRMNPNFQYAQAIPGLSEGRGIGLIESRAFTRVVDAVGLLQGSKSWTSEDHRRLREWFSQFLDWMIESKNGREEAAAKNNHGTYYDLQVTSYALFVGKSNVVSNVLAGVGSKRIARQIEPDGRQPLELARTKAWSYSLGNVQGLMMLAKLGQQAGFDWWNYSTSDGRNLCKAIEYLLPFAWDEKNWPHKEIGGFSGESFYPTLRRAFEHYRAEPFKSAMVKLPARDPASRSVLTE